MTDRFRESRYRQLNDALPCNGGTEGAEQQTARRHDGRIGTYKDRFASSGGALLSD